MPDMRRTIKDSVFTFLFRQPEYTRLLYLSLHPEDTSVTEEECKIVTLENILTTGLYNDLGIQVRDTLIFLVEAQSTFSENIPLRMLLYLAATYKEFTEEKKLDLYGNRPVSVPRPELYVVYTGTKEDVPDMLFLSNLYDGSGSVEVQVKVLRGAGTMDIVGQYVQFCQIADRNRMAFGLTQQAVQETIRQCIENDILVPFLLSRQKEVQDIMVTLFDQEKVLQIHDYNIAEAARWEGMQKGMEKGMQEERENSLRITISMLKRLQQDKDAAVQEISEQFGLSPQAAAEKVNQYWE